MGSGENTTEYAYSEELTEQMYNGKKGKLASSTGNQYGVYDLSGGRSELVAVYNEGTTLSAGKSLTEETEQQYVTKYNLLSDTPSYESYYPGDATYEVYTGIESRGWFSDALELSVKFGYPFLARGLSSHRDAHAGVFSSDTWNGDANDYRSFRVVLAGV